jgi:hypothetical protein
MALRHHVKKQALETWWRPHSRLRQRQRRAFRDRVLGAPFGAGAPHVVEFRPVRIDQALQRPAEVGKIRGKARSFAAGARVWVLIGASHGGSHIVSIGHTCSRDVSPAAKAFVARAAISGTASYWH